MELVKYDAMCRAIQICDEADEAKLIRDKAMAMEVYAKQAMNTDAERKVTEIRIRAERRCGELLAETEKAKGNQHINSAKSCDTTEQPKTLSEIGISRDQSSKWQKLAKVPNEEFETALKSEKPSTNSIITTIATLHTGDEESYTPKKYIDSARVVLGSIDLDPASNDLAQQTIKADKYYTVDDNGLNQPWAGRVWMNPPYTARVINEFIDKLINSYISGAVTGAIVLTNNNTDTSWFHAAARYASAICFTSGRINFNKRDGSKSSPTNGQSFFYFGGDVSPFIREFNQYGLLMVKA